MSFDESQEYFDYSNGYKHYTYRSSAWREISAKHDGSDIDLANIDVTNQILLDNNRAIYSKDSGGSNQVLLYMDASDLIHVGDTGEAITIDGTTIALDASSGTTVEGDLDVEGDITLTGATKDIDISNTAESTSGLRMYDSASPSTQFFYVLYDASGNVGILNAYSTLDLRINGTDEIQIDSSAITIPSNSLTLSSGALTVTTPSGVTLDVTCSNTSFATDLQQLTVNRAATSLYTFLATYSSNGADKEHNLNGDGNGSCDGSWTGGGADFAELMEWADGNPNNEDRVGWTVELVPNSDGKPLIKKCELPSNVIGVVSGAPTVVGNSDWNKWNGKHLVDAYGRYVMQYIEKIRWEERVKVEPKGNATAKKRIAKIERDMADELAGNAAELAAEAKALLDTYKAEERTERAAVIQSKRREKEMQIKAQMDVEDAAQPDLVQKGDMIEIAPKNSYGDIKTPEPAPVERTVTADQVKTARRKARKCARVQAEYNKMLSEVVAEADWKESIVYHDYPTGSVPDGLVPPVGAEVYISEERTLNPDFDPQMDHTPRSERPEWDQIGLCGLVSVNDDQITAPNWIKIGPVADGVSKWLIR